MQVNRRAEFARSQDRVRRPDGPAGRDWRELGSCRQVDPELFFPVKGDRESEAAALATCAGCPVLEQCRAEALKKDEKFGIWGGLTESGRQEMRRLLQVEAVGGGRVRGLSPRGDGRWALTAYYRTPQGQKRSVATTLSCSREDALVRLGELRARAAVLAAGGPAPDAGVGAGLEREAGSAAVFVVALLAGGVLAGLGAFALSAGAVRVGMALASVAVLFLVAGAASAVLTEDLLLRPAQREASAAALAAFYARGARGRSTFGRRPIPSPHPGPEAAGDDGDLAGVVAGRLDVDAREASREDGNLEVGVVIAVFAVVAALMPALNAITPAVIR